MKEKKAPSLLIRARETCYVVEHKFSITRGLTNAIVIGQPWSLPLPYSTYLNFNRIQSFCDFVSDREPHKILTDLYSKNISLKAMKSVKLSSMSRMSPPI